MGKKNGKNFSPPRHSGKTFPSFDHRTVPLPVTTPHVMSLTPVQSVQGKKPGDLSQAKLS